ncbi:SDR family NAD(P)-dependent oxidoreductase [Sphingomonas profundi]|uniref:SDR family NAD(P)-dependent oxidoreductase n=1 Tax=Alterirhizorhabdus profundi TaxID=2681549 RepID=UPI0012E89638|nr:SDR family oxidoreductase [Sphingomonas profundi]
MDLGLAGKRAIISGGSRGIGRTCARRLLEEGASVAFFARDQAAIDATVADLSPLGPVHGYSADAFDYAAVAAWVDVAAEALGGIDIVINNATASGQLEWGRQGWLDNFAVDLMSCVAMNDAALPWFEKAGGGAIVQIATITAIEHHDMPISPSYGAMKAATINLTAQLAQRWGPKNVRANCVSPGPIQFPGGVWDSVQISHPVEYERDRAQHPLKRLGTDDEVADVVVFLASDRARWVNGANVVVDGGYTKQVGF